MEQKHMFTNKMIADLLIPVVLEQLLNSIMGTADTMMAVSYTHLDVYKRQVSQRQEKNWCHDWLGK